MRRTELDPPIIGSSAAADRLRDAVFQLADTTANVLITGETGTGKELIARNLHAQGARSRRSFVAVNCAALNPGILESELFGHGRGSFTGAIHSHAGLFEQADGGTLFLDEIGDIPSFVQAKLLRVLQHREIRRMGTSDVRRVDVRIISATNADLEKKVEEGEFRLDLYYRLDVLAVHAPPLRERISDIPELIDYFFEMRGFPSPVLHGDALGILTRYTWPGNVRELDNEIERLVVLHPHAPEITPAMLSDRVTRRNPTELFDINILCESPLSRAVGYLEENLLRKTLAKTDWNKSRTARELGLSRQGLLKKIKRYGIVRDKTGTEKSRGWGREAGRGGVSQSPHDVGPSHDTSQRPSPSTQAFTTPQDSYRISRDNREPKPSQLMAAKKVRLALVGAGHVAQIAHLPAHRKHPDVELVALVDEDPVKCASLQKQYGIERTYDDFTRMLEKEDIDAVDICTPNFLHAPMAIAALRSGRHVLCEKPLARNVAEAERMVETAKKSGRFLMVAMNNRFRRDVEALRTFVRRGELGDVQLVKVGWQRIARDWQARRWVTDQRKAGGGALLDLGVPLMDLAIWIAGLKKPTRVTCNVFGRKGKGGVEDSACALVNFAGGSSLILDVTWNLLEPNDRSYLEIHGTKGGANLHPLKIQKALHGHLVNVTPSLVGRRNAYKESHQAQINHFVECIQRKRKPLTAGENALSVLRILDALYRSASAGKEVSFV